MASINFKGKTAVWNHHLSVPYHTLEKDKKNSLEGKNDAENLIIEGDNLLALKALLPKYQGKVKCIYIDPPYNTGNESWVYNDKVNNPVIKNWIGEVVGKDGDDLVRHDKWLAMMTPRMKLLKEMLSEDGVIFISIDENEQANLKILSDEIFGEPNFVTSFAVVRSEGGGLAKQAVIGHEYVLVYAKNISEFTPLAKKKDVRGQIVTKDGEEYIVEEDWLRREFGKYGTTLYSEIEEIKGVEKKAEIDAGLKSGEYVLLDKPQGQIVGRYKKLSEQSSKFYTVLKHLNKNGKEDLEKLGMENLFDYPKPKSLIKELISGATFWDKDAIVLDSFSGSGTTAQAVLELNEEDGGNRQFILVQIPEEINKDTPAYKAGYKWVHEITRERVKKVVKLSKVDAGFTYYKLGPDIDGKKILTGKDMPTWDSLAKYVHFLATGKPTDDVTMQKKTWQIISKKKDTQVYLIYADSIEELKKLAITRDWLDTVKDKDGKKIVYAPACFLDKEILDEYNISFVQVPFNLFSRK